MYSGESDQVSWREYHELTKHSVESLRRNRRPLDWANMPNPFRHYEGVPVIDLPADPLIPDIPAIEVLRGSTGRSLAKDGSAFLSQLMFYSSSISAMKRVPATKNAYALRVNPSSGNLHPTEFHFCTQGLIGWPNGLYHYLPSSHMAEQRAIGEFVSKIVNTAAPLVFVLTSIAWREAWKYGDRGYRYCMHDIGHAWQALSLAARSMGCESFAAGDFADDAVSEVCRLSEDEWPMLFVTIQGSSVPVNITDPPETVWFRGEPNQLSDEQVGYPLIEKIHVATKCRSEFAVPTLNREEENGRMVIKLPLPISTNRNFGDVVRSRRSALDFRGGYESMSLPQLATLLSITGEPFLADFSASRFVQLYLYVHRVEGLVPGVYRYWPEDTELEMIKEGDQRLVSAALSLGQDLAGNACVTFSMIGNFENAVCKYGDRGYRYVHFEAGAIGQRMYLAAEALGLRATGIGAFFDDAVNGYLGVAAERGQVVYHFALGHPIPDSRLEA